MIRKPAPLLLAASVTASIAIVGACMTAPNTATAPTISAALDAKSLKFTMHKWNTTVQSEGTTPVNGTFKDFTLSLSKKVVDLKKPADLNGLVAKVEVPLADTNIDTGVDANGNPVTLRNGRIADVYFEAAKFSAATFTFNKFTTTSTADAFKVGEALDVTAEGELDLHGVKKPVSGVKLKVTPVDGGLQIATTEDLSIKSVDYELPWEALLKECGHKGLNEAATVSFDVTVK